MSALPIKPVEHRGVRDRGELLARGGQSLLDRLAGGAPLGHRDLAVAVGERRVRRVAPGRCRLLLPALGLGLARLRRTAAGELAASRGGPAGLGDELLERLGVDERLAAAAEPRPLAAAVTAGPVPARARRRGTRRSSSTSAGARAGSGGRSCSCAGSGRPACARIRSPSVRLIIAGHSASATISPLCARWPLIRGAPSIRRHRLRRPLLPGRGRHAALVQVGADRARRLARQETAGALAHDLGLRRHGSSVLSVSQP